MTETTTLVQQVRQYAIEHYEDGGWDVIVECYTDDEIASQITGARTLSTALKRFDTLIDVWSDRQADARNSAF